MLVSIGDSPARSRRSSAALYGACAGRVPLIVPQPFDILAAIALIYGAGVLTGFNLARRVTGFMLGGKAILKWIARPISQSRAGWRDCGRERSRSEADRSPP
jgi:hypothetical protein